MSLKKYIPNLLTLLNLLSGTIAVIFAVNNNLEMAAYLVFLGIFFDFFDGFAARMFNVQGELGKQLDSLADVVTSGVVPGIVMYKLLQTKESLEIFNTKVLTWESRELEILPFFGLVITLAAAYRLAKFNIDERQSSSFIGLPTPAAALVVLSIPLIGVYGSYDFVLNLIENKVFLILITIVLAIIMNAEIPLFSLKFKNFSYKNNRIQFIFIACTLLLCILLQFAAIPLVILVYVLFSIIENRLTK